MALTNNDIIKKLRVALSLRDTDIIEILKLVDFEISKTELSAFFRADDHEKFMPLKDQILRNFLNGLVIYKRGRMEKKKKPDEGQSNKKSLPPKEFRKPLGVKPPRGGNTKVVGKIKYRKKNG